MAIVYWSEKGAQLTTVEMDNNFQELYDLVTNQVSDDAYGVGWDGEGAIAPSQNAVYDLSLLLLPLDGSRSMTSSLNFTAGNKGLTWASGSYVKDDSGNLQIYSSNSSDLNINSAAAFSVESAGTISLTSLSNGIYIVATGGEISYTADQNINFTPGALYTNIFNRGARLNYATASTVTYLDASKNLVSLANGTGALTNDGSGGLSYVQYQPLDSDLTSWAGVTRASGFDTFAATPSSVNLKGLVTDETGSGALVFADTPTLVTPVLGVATATSINKLTLTAPATSATLTLADGSSLITTGAFNTTFAAGATATMTLPTTSQTLAGLGVTGQTFTTAQTFTGSVAGGLYSAADFYNSANSATNNYAGITFSVKNSAASPRMGKINYRLTTTTSTSEVAEFQFQLYKAGTITNSYTFNSGSLTLDDAINIVGGTSTGHKLLTATSQKLGIWNATPIVQPSGSNQAALTNSTGGSYDGTLQAISGTGADAAINNNFTDIHTLLNEIRTNVLVAIGLMKGSA
jgi:hypothetical protein